MPQNTRVTGTLRADSCFMSSAKSCLTFQSGKVLELIDHHNRAAAANARSFAEQRGRHHALELQPRHSFETHSADTTWTMLKFCLIGFHVSRLPALLIRVPAPF